MNVTVTCLLAILTIFTVGIASEAFAVITMTLETDKDTYDHESMIVVTGHVEPIDPNSSDVAIVVERVDPVGIVQFAQVSVDSNGNFSTTINTANTLMKYDGTYLIRAQYVNTDVTVAIELTTEKQTYSSEIPTTATTTPGTSETILYKLEQGGPIEYDISCSTLEPTFMTNPDNNTLEINIEGTNDGTLTLTLSEEIIKPLSDGSFAVFVDGQQTDFDHDGYTLIIPCEAGDNKIEIVGSWVIPEFGTIAVMILVVAIVAIIAVSAKTKLSLVPRY